VIAVLCHREQVGEASVTLTPPTWDAYCAERGVRPADQGWPTLWGIVRVRLDPRGDALWVPQAWLPSRPLTAGIHR
jgi:hypothetical protein